MHMSLTFMKNAVRLIYFITALQILTDEMTKKGSSGIFARKIEI